jgi:hypothetical protein
MTFLMFSQEKLFELGLVSLPASVVSVVERLDMVTWFDERSASKRVAPGAGGRAEEGAVEVRRRRSREEGMLRESMILSFLGWIEALVMVIGVDDERMRPFSANHEAPSISKSS